MVEEEKNQFAVLIDADNISPKYASIIFQELEHMDFRHVEEFMETGRKPTDGMKNYYWNILLFQFSNFLTHQEKMQQIWQW